MEKINLRAVFEKSGRAVFISHLDLFRTMQRAIKRSKIPVWYSQGFNPHIYLNFPLALSLGVASKTEFMDFSVTENVEHERIRDMLNEKMPDGLSIISVGAPVHPNKDIGYAEYIIRLKSDAEAEKMLGELEKMMAMEVIEIDKRSKSKGTVKIDVKPHFNILKAESEEDALVISIRLPAGLVLNVNSNVFVDTFSVISGIHFNNVYAERTKILLADGEKFV